jgi:hypothetical protein
MFITKKTLSRRTVLRGLGATAIALPFLDAMTPAFAQTPDIPFRFGAVYVPNGVFPDAWHPDVAGKDFEFKNIMLPMEPFRDQLVTVSGMRAPSGSIHLGASSAWLNGVGPAGKAGDFTALVSQKTLDQHIADRVAGDTPLRSLELGTEDMATVAGACDGYPCAFFNSLAWRDDTTPLPVTVNPRVMFERMFGEAGTTDQRARNNKLKQSILDSVVGESKAFSRRLNASDRLIMDEWLANIRDVEQQLQRMDARMNTLPDADAPIGIPELFDDHITINYNLMYLAYRGDISRVATFAVGHEASSRSYAHIGVPDAHHSISHHGNNPETLAKYNKINTYHIAKMAELVARMASTPEGNGTMLDHSLLYFGAGMSNGNVHDRNNPPALLVGGAHGRLEGNRHIIAPKDTPVANLLVSIGELAGADLTSIGPSTGKVKL